MANEMFPEELDAGETAIDYTNQFLDAAVQKLDSTFGEGYAKKNPAVLSGYIAACSTNLAAFMTASMGMMDFGLDDEDADEDEMAAALRALAAKAGGHN